MFNEMCSKEIQEWYNKYCDEVLNKLPYVKNPMGHVWKEFDGFVDIFGYSVDIHNGPICVNCGYSFCHHCHELPQQSCPKGEKNENSNN